MKFEWDKNKNNSNIEKHGIDFNNITEVFQDQNKVIVNVEKSEEKYGEKRKIVIGKIINIYYTVVYTIRKRYYRIISARKASKKERKLYNELNP